MSKIDKKDEVVDGRWKIERQLAYKGRENCTDVRCTRLNSYIDGEGNFHPGECYGWHCPNCHQPCSMMGCGCIDESD